MDSGNLTFERVLEGVRRDTFSQSRNDTDLDGPRSVRVQSGVNRKSFEISKDRFIEMVEVIVNHHRQDP